MVIWRLRPVHLVLLLLMVAVLAGAVLMYLWLERIEWQPPEGALLVESLSGRIFGIP